MTLESFLAKVVADLKEDKIHRSGTLKDARKEQELLKQRPELLKQQEDSQKK